jgi:8-oxo-dGTP pyrophosphatase MutT (NUDIX family)
MRDNHTFHPVQVGILLQLSRVSEASFAQLNTQHLDTDWFSYHLKQAVKNGLVEKTTEKVYLLTEYGKKTALQFDTQTQVLQYSQRVSVQLVAQVDQKYWIQHRQIEPYYGVWEFPTMKVKFGERPIHTVERLLSEEGGITGNPEFCGINHKIERTTEGSILDDKYLLIFRIGNISSELSSTFEGGTNHWLTKSELLKKDKLHFNLHETFAVIEQKQMLTEVESIAHGY